MDMSSGEWLTELGNEDPTTLIHHCQLMMSSQSLEEFENIFQPTEIFIDNDESTNNLQFISSLEIKPHKSLSNGHVITKEIKSECHNKGWGSYTSSPNTSCGRIISFGSSEIESHVNNDGVKLEKDIVNHVSGTKSSALVKNSHHRWSNKVVGSTSLCSQEHVLAERKRREKMTERFIALSALIPGLKKMDKASILGDAANYVKQLEEQIKKLEEQTDRRTVESVVLVKKSQNESNCNNNVDYTSSSNANHDNNMDNTTRRSPEHVDIEARISNNNVLIRIHAEKKEGLIQFVLSEIGNLHLTTLNFNTMPFGKFAVDITITAQIEDEQFNMGSKDLVKHLGFALQEFSSL